MLKMDSGNPRLHPGCVLHTDSAKAYKQVGQLHHPGLGALQDGEEFCRRFSQYNWVHTTVTHKKKPGRDTNYTLRRWITTSDGKCHGCVCGTQTVDGLWASLRRTVGRSGIHTGQEDSEARRRLYKFVRHFQWQWWNFHLDRFPLLCDLV